MQRRTVLLIALLAFVASNLVVALSPNLPMVGRFIGGAWHGLMWAVMPPTIGRISGPAGVGRAMAIVLGTASVWQSGLR